MAPVSRCSYKYTFYPKRTQTSDSLHCLYVVQGIMVFAVNFVDFTKHNFLAVMLSYMA